MNNPHPLSDIAQLYQQHKQLFQNSVAAVSSERKDQTLAQKIYDYLADTSSEQEMAKFSGSFSRMEKEARYRVDRWVDNNVVHQLKESGEFSSWIEVGEERYKTQKFYDKVNSAIKLGEKAMNALESASDACRHARNMEMIDAVSSSKSVAAASALANQSARDWLKTSDKSVKAYLAEFTDNDVKHVSPDNSKVDWDLVVDLVLPGVSDILSVSNMLSFSERARNCDRVKESIMQSLQPLYATRDILINEEKNLANNMDAVTNRTRDKLQQTIPSELNDVINPNNPVQFRSHLDPKTIDDISTLASSISLNDFIKSKLEAGNEKEKKAQPSELSM